jgi:2'-5' RNA ligase
VSSDHPRTGLVVPVPEAEAAVGAHRLRLDPSAALGAPAHVTVLFPFVPADALDEAVLTAVADVVGQARAFDYTFARTDWFDDRVVWLAPEDPAPFRDLTACVTEAFPGYPPYEGAFADVVPHLTLGEGHRRGLLEQAAAAVAAHLPVTGVAVEVLLLAETQRGGRWDVRGRFPLSRR